MLGTAFQMPPSVYKKPAGKIAVTIEIYLLSTTSTQYTEIMTGRRKTIIFRVPDGQRPSRLDQYINSHISDISRTRVKLLIDTNQVKLNREECKPSQLVSGGDIIEIYWPWPEPPPIAAEAIPLDIVYEDEHLLIVNKPAGLVVHPARRNYSGTLINALLFHCKDYPSSIKPRIIHRIDKETSGILVVPKTIETFRALQRQFKTHRIECVYRGITTGIPRPLTSEIKAPIRDGAAGQPRYVSPNGKPAFTAYRTVKKFNNFALLEFRLKTGRTHQIRVHTAHKGVPILGDGKYGQRHPIPDRMNLEKRNALMTLVNRHMLHAMVLGFIHPATGESLTFSQELPEDMTSVLSYLSLHDRN